MAVAANDLRGRIVPSMHIEGLGVPAVLQEVAIHANLTIGLEMDVRMGTENHVTINFPGGTIADLANRCTSLLRGASWRITGHRGIIITQPGEASSLAAMHIQYAGITKATRQQVWSGLLHSSEFEGWLHSSGCRSSDLLRGHEWEGDRPSIFIPKDSLSLETLLDTATASSGSHLGGS